MFCTLFGYLTELSFSSSTQKNCINHLSQRYLHPSSLPFLDTGLLLVRVLWLKASETTSNLLRQKWEHCWDLLKVYGVVQKIEGKIENLVSETAEPRAALGFHIIVINGQIFYLCCLTEYSNSRTELGLLFIFWTRKGGLLELVSPSWWDHWVDKGFKKFFHYSPHLTQKFVFPVSYPGKHACPLYNFTMLIFIDHSMIFLHLEIFL